MKKQVLYPGLISRLFATLIDFWLLEIILSLLQNLLPVGDPKNYKGSVGYLDYSVEQFVLVNSLINLLTITFFFLSLWFYKNSTIGKIILHMKIVDAKTLQAPTKYQLIKRFIAYPTALIGIWLIPLTEQNQALHDKIAGTAVIKT